MASGKTFESSLSVDLEKLATLINILLPTMTFGFAVAGYLLNFNFHFLTVACLMLTVVNLYYLKVQKKHTLLSNFGLVAQLRYIIESVGPEFRQYLFLADTEEKPFNRIERSEVYRKAKGIDSSSPFGSQLSFQSDEIKIRHSMYPISKESLQPYNLIFGEERQLKHPYTLKHPVMISAMSYGALGANAIRALARGARKAGIPMNTGEGGFPKYHLQEKGDLIFQMGTAKFGVRNEDGTLDPSALEAISKKPEIKMIEIKFSQGAKPGKGGLLPKEKITEEISQLRGVPQGQDVVSPAYHAECTTPEKTVDFIATVQEVSQLPVGVKICVGNVPQLKELVQVMKQKNIFPDFISIDGAEGGTGAAPKSFMDDFGLPIFRSLPLVQKILKDSGVRDRLKLIAAGKLVSPGKQFMAYSMGAEAVYSARGFMLALGCIQALQCHNNTCPVGITTHNKHLQSGLDIEDKAQRVANYVHSLVHDHDEMLAATGCKTVKELTADHLYWNGEY